MTRKWSVNQEQLRRLYHKDRLSLSEIGRKLGMPKPTIRELFIRFNIPRRTRYEGIKNYFNRYYKKIWRDLSHIQYTDEEKRLLALAIDLEGCIAITKRKTDRLMGYVEITNTSMKMLQYIKEIAKIGNIYHCGVGKGNRKPYATWHLGGFAYIKFFLEQIKDYLIIKKKQARLMIRFCEFRLRSPRAPYSEEEMEIYYKMIKLNKRGLR